MQNTEPNDRYKPHPKRESLAKKASHLPDIHRLLPQSPESEQGVLSSFLLAPREVGAMLEAKGILPDHFHIPAHGTIFRLLMKLWAEEKPIDFITIGQILRNDGQLDEVGGAPFISSLFTFLPTAANAAYYLEIVQEKFVLRQMIRDCTEIAARCYDEQDAVPALMEDYQKRAVMLMADREGSKKRFTPLRDLLRGSIARLEERSQMKGKLSGGATGIADIDRMTDGIGDQEMVLVVGRPSMGKTALAMQCGLFMAKQNSYFDDPKRWEPLPTVVFSVEMSEMLLGDRLLAQITGVSVKRFADGFMSVGQHNAMVANMGAKLSEYCDPRVKFWVDDTPALSIQQLTARVRYAVEQMGARVVVVDYAQLLTSTSKKAQQNRLQEVAEISTGLKNLGRVFGVKLIVAAQLNRDVDERPGHVPLLSDLRECGQLEQDADAVLAPVRPYYYAKTDVQKAKLIDRIGQIPHEGKWRDCDEDDAKKYAEVHLLKQRNGATGFAKCWFHGEQCWFEGWTKKLFSNNVAERQQNLGDNQGSKGGGDE